MSGVESYLVRLCFLTREFVLCPEFGGCFALCLVRGGMGMVCFHYIGCVEAGEGVR